MDAQYVDQYVRRRKGGLAAPAPQASTAAASSLGPIERAVQSTPNVQSFVDRTDSLHTHVATLDDKVHNLAKIVKLSQSLSDEKEVELRKENAELKSRLKRQEQLTNKIAADLIEAQKCITQQVPESLQQMSINIKTELGETQKAIKETAKQIDRKNSETRSDLLEAILSQTDSMIEEKIVLLREMMNTQGTDLRSKQVQDIDSLERRLQSLEHQKLDSLQHKLDERIEQSAATAREKIFVEVKGALRGVNDESRSEFTRMREAMHKMESRCTSLENALSEFMKNYRDSVHLHASKMEETATGVRELVGLQEQTRSVVAAELERTKEWATRNMHRLKKHIDTLNSDIASLKTAHLEVSSQMESMKRHAADERERISVLLQQKAREATILTDMVDREIAGIHAITATHKERARSPGLKPRPRETPPPSLYDELAFVERAPKASEPQRSGGV